MEGLNRLLSRCGETARLYVADVYGTDRAGGNALALARALGCDYLADRRVNPVRMHVQGFGKTEPIASNATIQGRAANRRVEIVLSRSRPDRPGCGARPMERHRSTGRHQREGT